MATFGDDDMEQDYSVVYRKVQYPRLEFKTGNLLLVLPEGADKEEILAVHSSWIKEKKKIIDEALQASESKELYTRSYGELKITVNELIDQYSDYLGEKPNKVLFRAMNSKWASCSRNRNITINRLLRHLPEHLLSYVIYHEMVHLLEKQHNILFWNKIEEKFPDWKTLENDLLIYWFLIQRDGHSKMDVI
ncbi:M48 metallopeptidase family protein [Methanoculleus bourgensis]|jgi:predicted metal-dependent hydrolase|uniref:YgjP-like metallopeptidase domain-containing protein n=1 Tax=Methanoculleus bourgensis TaxID=83986 RepID=A0A0X3BLW9_9EURY|nr:M48 family metallopeptidase [Methanoculleus bourgensis]CVK32465.1 conserved protein of unknown function [Methanoculleus bourgensis]